MTRRTLSPTRRAPAYDAPAAKQAWERMMAFLGKHL